MFGRGFLLIYFLGGFLLFFLGGDWVGVFKGFFIGFFQLYFNRSCLYLFSCLYPLKVQARCSVHINKSGFKRFILKYAIIV